MSPALRGGTSEALPVSAARPSRAHVFVVSVVPGLTAGATPMSPGKAGLSAGLIPQTCCLFNPWTGLPLLFRVSPPQSSGRRGRPLRVAHRFGLQAEGPALPRPQVPIRLLVV